MSPRPPEHTERIESEPVAPPCTPNRRPGDEINEIVLSLESRWGLGLSVRDKPVSPSASNGSIPDKVYNKIQHMYFKKRKLLDRILAEFDSHASEKPSGSEKLDYLLRLLTEEIGSPGHHQSPVHLGKRPHNFTSLYLVDGNPASLDRVLPANILYPSTLPPHVDDAVLCSPDRVSSCPRFSQ